MTDWKNVCMYKYLLICTEYSHKYKYYNLPLFGHSTADGWTRRSTRGDRVTSRASQQLLTDERVFVRPNDASVAQ